MSQDRSKQKYLVLSAGITPSVYYYFQMRAALRDAEDIQCIDTGLNAPNASLLIKNTVVIVNRFIGLSWLIWIVRHQHLFRNVVYFLDDDMPNAYKSSELSWRYGSKTSLRFRICWFFLRRMKSQLWCSTEVLAKRLIEFSPQVVVPIYVPTERIITKRELVYFYHGTWAHRHEIAWLVPIVKEIQERFPEYIFEIIGNRKVKKMFAGIPRVRLLPGMQWDHYLKRSSKLQYRVGLAPCFSSSFNQCRSYTKIFDITRVGAVGIYSAEIPYRDIIANEVNGWLVPNNQKSWIDAIAKALLLPESELEEIYGEAVSWCKKNSEQTSLLQHLLPT